MRMHSDTKTDQGEPLACPKRIDRSALGRALNSRRSREYNAKDKNSGAESHHVSQDILCHAVMAVRSSLCKLEVPDACAAFRLFWGFPLVPPVASREALLKFH